MGYQVEVLINTARTMLIEAKLPLSFQAEVVSTAIYEHNVTPQHWNLGQIINIQ